jgi:hypothetical protein
LGKSAESDEKDMRRSGHERRDRREREEITRPWERVVICSCVDMWETGLHDEEESISSQQAEKGSVEGSY